MSMLGLSFDPGLPLERLDNYIVCDDALFCEWPKCDVIIGNPPYQSKNKMQTEMEKQYIDRVRERYPGVPGRADYCVYWFRRTHDEMKEGQRAGLVGTNTIRQNYSREGGLDHIVNNGGTITDAVSTQVWSGDAVVYVSIVNWIKGQEKGMKRLAFQRGDTLDSPFSYYDLDTINSSLSATIDLTAAAALDANAKSKACFQGQTHGDKGFLITADERAKFSNSERIYPYLIGDELLSYKNGARFRYVIDLNDADDVFQAKTQSQLYEHLRASVYPAMKQKAEEEQEKTGKDTGPRQSHFRKWWRFWRARNEMMSEIAKYKRYIACSRVTKRPVFEFVSSEIHPNDQLQVFPLDDDYSFGILQSSVHWEWFVARCSTLKADPRYTSNTVFDSFPWPQSPTYAQVVAIARASTELRKVRRRIMVDNQMNLREVYRIAEETPANPVSAAQDNLDEAVFSAYGLKQGDDVLSFLLELNLHLADKQNNMKEVVGPGLPPSVSNREEFITDDCICAP